MNLIIRALSVQQFLAVLQPATRRGGRGTAQRLCGALFLGLAVAATARAQGIFTFLERTAGHSVRSVDSGAVATSEGRLLALELRATEVLQQGLLGDALQAAQELEAFTTEHLPADHWRRSEAMLGVQFVKELLAAAEPHRQAAAKALLGLGQAHRLLDAEKIAEAEPLYRQYAEFCLKVCGADHAYTAASQVFLGHALVLARQLPEAEQLGKQALSAALRIHGRQHPLAGGAHYYLGTVLRERGRDREAMESFRNALLYFERFFAANHALTLQAQSQLAGALERLGQLFDAEVLHRKSLASYVELDGADSPAAERVRGLLAVNLGLQGRHPEAEELARRSLATRLRLHGSKHAETARALNNLGVELYEQGRRAEAEEFLRRALEIRLELNLPESVSTRTSLARLLLDRGELDEAESLFRLAVASHLARAGENHLETTVARGWLAVCWQRQGRLQEAEKLLVDSLARSRSLVGKDHAQTRGLESKLSEVHAAQNRHTSVEALCRERLESDRKTLGEDHPYTSMAHGAVGVSLYRQGRAVDAVAYLDRAGEIAFKALGDAHPLTAASLNNLATAYFASGKVAEAEVVWSQARASHEAVAAASGMSGLERARQRAVINGSPWNALAVLSARSGKAAEALQNLEAGLARGWRGELASSSLSGVPIPGEAYGIDEIQKCLRADEALVAWIGIGHGDAPCATPTEDWAIVLRQRGPPVAVRVATIEKQARQLGAEDKAMPADLLRGLRSPSGAEVASPASDLTAQLRARWVTPLVPHLQGVADLPAVRQLVVLTSESSLRVPVAVLTQDYAVSHVPAATMFAWLRRQGPAGDARQSKRAFLGVGNRVVPPAFGDAKEVILLSGVDASESRLKALATNGQLRQFHHLHFATAADLTGPLAVGCALALAREPAAIFPTPDGQLTAAEILQHWHLEAELVVLSGSDTGAGNVAFNSSTSGDGYLGFAQALLGAGARCVLLRLWPVPERASNLLLQRFYANVLQRNLSRADALAEAQRWLRELGREEAERDAGKDPGEPLPAGQRPYAHSHFWAGLVLIGDAR